MAFLCHQPPLLRSAQLQLPLLQKQCQPSTQLRHTLFSLNPRLYSHSSRTPRPLNHLAPIRSLFQSSQPFSALRLPALNSKTSIPSNYLPHRSYRVPQRGTQPQPHFSRPTNQYTPPQQPRRETQWKPPSPPNLLFSLLPKLIALIPNLLIFTCIALFIPYYFSKANNSSPYAENNPQLERLHTLYRRNFFDNQINRDEGRWWVSWTSALLHGNFLHLGINMYAAHSILPSAAMIFTPTTLIGIMAISQFGTFYASEYWQTINKTFLSRSIAHVDMIMRSADTQDQRIKNALQPQNALQEPTFLGKKPSPKSVDTAMRTSGSVGFSGVLSGVVAAMSLKMPWDRVQLLFFIPMPMIVGSALWVSWSWYAMDHMPNYMDNAGHFGGSIGGFAAAILFWRFGMKARWR